MSGYKSEGDTNMTVVKESVVPISFIGDPQWTLLYWSKNTSVRGIPTRIGDTQRPQ